MDYTLSNSYVADVGTGLRMHLQAQAVPTAVSDNDINQLIWELMEIVKAGGQVGAPFDKAAPATYQKLLTALRSTGVFLTPPQFDVSNRVATAAFVKRQGLEASGVNVIAGGGVLAAINCGQTIVFGAAASAVLNMPLAGVCPPGGRIEFLSISVPTLTIATQGADQIYTGSSLLTTMAVLGGDTLVLESNGVDRWYAVGGSARLRYAAGLASSLLPNGYKRTPDANSPNGFLITEWGNIAAIPANGSGVVTYSIAFPNAVLSVAPIGGGGAPAMTGFIGGYQFDGGGNRLANFLAFNGSSTVAAAPGTFIAIGY